VDHYNKFSLNGSENGLLNEYSACQPEHGPYQSEVELLQEVQDFHIRKTAPHNKFRFPQEDSASPTKRLVPHKQNAASTRQIQPLPREYDLHKEVLATAVVIRPSIKENSADTRRI
jgi:hypothetical protein